MTINNEIIEAVVNDLQDVYNRVCVAKDLLKKTTVSDDIPLIAAKVKIQSAIYVLNLIKAQKNDTKTIQE